MAERFSITNILLVVDGTESGVRAARFGVQLAAFHKASVAAVAVVDTATLKSLLTSSVLVESEMEEFDEELGASAQTNLNYASQLAKAAGVNLTPLLRKGSAHVIISDEIRDAQPDLLVMGSFTTSMIKRDLSARNRRLIVDDAQCPIVLVP